MKIHRKRKDGWEEVAVADLHDGDPFSVRWGRGPDCIVRGYFVAAGDMMHSVEDNDPYELQKASKEAKKRTGGVSITAEEYTDDEREFIVAMESYRSKNRRPFPTCCEVLAVLKNLGYRRQSINP